MIWRIRQTYILLKMKRALMIVIFIIFEQILRINIVKCISRNPSDDVPISRRKRNVEKYGENEHRSGTDNIPSTLTTEGNKVVFLSW